MSIDPAATPNDTPPMRRLLSVVPLLALPALSTPVLLAGCDKGEDKKEDKEEAAPTPFEGELTAALIDGLSDADKPSPFDPWDKSLAKVESKLGKPSKVDGGDHSWAVVDGDSCSYITIEKDGDKVGMVEGPGKMDKAMKSMYEKCVVASGGEVVAEIDPNAPKVPTDGSAVKPSVLMEGVKGAETEWVGKTVTVEGVFFSTSKSKASGSDEETIILSIKDDKDGKDSIGCTLVKGEAAPELMQYDPITVSGEVEATFGGGLKACKVVPGAEGGEAQEAKAEEAK